MKMVLRLISSLQIADVKSNFDDVVSSTYYYEAVGIAKSLGIATGAGNNQFLPEATITREEAAVLIDRALRAANI